MTIQNFDDFSRYIFYNATRFSEFTFVCHIFHTYNFITKEFRDSDDPIVEMVNFKCFTFTTIILPVFKINNNIHLFVIFLIIKITM